MVNPKDYQRIVSSISFLEKSLLGRTVTRLDLDEGEIHFDDGSVLSLIWHPEYSIGFELFEKPLVYYKNDEPLSPEDKKLVEKSWERFKELTE